MAGESVVDSIKVTAEELLEIFVIENAQIRLELQAQKLLNMKLRNLIQESEEIA